MQNLLKKIPSPFQGELITRSENCRICNESSAIRIGEVEFWDIRKSRIVWCGECHHVQLDPMLTDEETAKGCLAYYIEESLRISVEEQKKNCVRNFRRGVVFGYKLKRRNINPELILEIGPGSGYFAAGIQFVFPDCRVTVMDINQGILDFNEKHHQSRTIRNIPDNCLEEYYGMFDLVIARDILEHVTDVSKVISNLEKYLKPGGYFHFITPNGHEDVWKHYLRSKFSGAPSELLINHVNYFDGEGLGKLLFRNGFMAVEYYTFGFKRTARGEGWKMNRKLSGPPGGRYKADHFINERMNDIPQMQYGKEKILDHWYIRKNAKWITRLFSLYQHFSVLRSVPENNIGHEIYGLFKKS